MRSTIDRDDVARLERVARQSRAASRQTASLLKARLLNLVSSPTGLAWSMAAGALYGARKSEDRTASGKRSALATLLVLSRYALIGRRLIDGKFEATGFDGDGYTP